MKHVFADHEFPLHRLEARPADRWDHPDIIRTAFSVETLLRSKRLILAGIVFCLVLAAAYLALRPDRFLAKTSIVVGSNVSNASAQRALLEAEGQLQTQIDMRTRLLARIARLDSEIRGDEAIQFPNGLLEQGQNPTTANILNGEKLIHDARREALASTLQSLRQLRDLTTSEVGALTEQARYAREQQKSIDQEVGVIRDLSKKGLAPANRLSDLERTAASFATRRIEVETRLLNRQQDIFATDQKIADATGIVRNAALVDLQQARAELRAIEFKIAAQTGVSASAPADAGALANQTEVMKSDDTARQIVQRLGLGDNAAFYQKASLLPAFLARVVNPVEPGSPEAIDAAARRVQNDLVVERVGAGSRLDIAFQAEQAPIARQVADALARQFTSGTGPGEPALVAAGGGSQILRAASVSRLGPPAMAVLIGAVLAGLALGGATAFLVRYLRLAAAVPPPLERDA